MRGLCFKDHTDVNRLEFLPHHFLLASIGEQGVLRYQDTTHGAIVAQFRTKLGSCDAMRQNPHNAVMHLGHSNGTVTLWSPNMGHPLVKMLTHRGPVRSLAVDSNGRYMATAGADSQVKAGGAVYCTPAQLQPPQLVCFKPSTTNKKPRIFLSRAFS